MIKLIRNISVILIVMLSSVIMTSQIYNANSAGSDIFQITKHFNLEHVHKFAFSSLDIKLHKIDNSVPKVNFSNNESLLFILAGFSLLIFISYERLKIFTDKLTHNHFITAFLIPPEFS
ncbi:MAG: hypothetical protein K1X86_15340 [Ignavibacteria bacterium]|nr:hypothetical protein [Ignavibacteria bacterium]